MTDRSAGTRIFLQHRLVGGFGHEVEAEFSIAGIFPQAPAVAMELFQPETKRCLRVLGLDVFDRFNQAAAKPDVDEVHQPPRPATTISSKAAPTLVVTGRPSWRSRFSNGTAQRCVRCSARSAAAVGQTSPR